MTSSLPEIRAITGNRYIRSLLRWITKQSLSSIYFLSWGVTAAAAFYGATVIFGLVAGYALPPAALFALLPAAHGVSYLEPFNVSSSARTAAYQSCSPLDDRFRLQF